MSDSGSAAVPTQSQGRSGAQLRPAAAPLPRGRNEYADLLRGTAIVTVVVGHWLATAIVYRDGRPAGVDALAAVPWAAWLTLLFQVMPMFFLVGGYVNAESWCRHRDGGGEWSAWVAHRMRRLLLPAAGYVAVIALAVAAAGALGADPATLAQASWGVALHLWFLAAYAVLLTLAPLLYTAHTRWGLAVAVVMAGLAAAVDVGVLEFHWHFVGWLNYLFVWGMFHQLGFAWRDGLLARRWRTLLLAAVPALALVLLIWRGPYPVSMVGVPGARIQNASPPSTALLAFGLAQLGVALLCEPSVSRWLIHHRRSRAMVRRSGALTMPVYLWHMVPVIIVVLTGYPRLGGEPRIGSALWWAEQGGWVVVLGVVLAALLAVLAPITRAVRRGLSRLPAVIPVSASSPAYAAWLLVPGVGASVVGIGRLAISGFAPGGRLDILPLLALGLGLLLVVASSQQRPAVAR